ncbi:hypothetical protein N7491_007670 [Penicillium cf. griseofulvum]|uniref:NmrA-like domain-containing protein n=1 Tax=Penicillium cf. griseofulvum TaxID=2972120 RepID=A0A9W9M0G3_9EURO|nr:hypothetical protein N7472_009305 [Penicillium cf. griseofulvum]KAJ5430654.1 hypothetical protein N7491_007670 [Penicillium cf. griseofulvum]KAJ5435578.1 hypothetical protein N7445_006463 [Penicillium cf. griseofulvum]
MAIIAVAGGTGKLGRAIVEALKATTSHTIYILARKENKDLSEELGVPIEPTQYSNVESLAKFLEDNKIDTIVSAMAVVDDNSSSSQLNLIAAANQSLNTKRFIPSEYGIAYTEEHAALFPIVEYKLAAIQKLQSTALEYTLVSNGFFMDYYGLPRANSYLQPFVFALDMAQNAAAIPGSGDTPVVFTHTFDVAKFVAALISQADWPKRSIIIGDKKTWNEALAIAEETKGTKFNVTYRASIAFCFLPFPPKEQLQYILAVFGRWTAAGDFDFPEIDTLNSRFPNIETRTLRQVMEQGWKA